MAGVILIEDNADYRFFIQSLLERHGVRVRALSNAWSLLAAMEAEPADLIVTDLYMPRMDGLEVVRSVRRKFTNVPIIGMTGAAADDTSVKAFALFGADVVLSKPVSEAAFLALVRDKLPPSYAVAA